MSKYLIVILLSLGLTMMINAHITIKRYPNRIKRAWANVFLLGGMILFFWGVSETMVKFIDYMFKMVTMVITMSKFKGLQ